MSRWTDTFKAHAFHSDLDSFAKRLEQDDLPGTDDLDVAQELSRLRKVVAYVTATLENVDPELVSPSLLGTLQSQLSAVVSEFGAYAANGNVGHLRNANGSIDPLLITVAQAPQSASGGAKASLTRAATAYQESMLKFAADYRAAVEKERNAAQSELSSLRGAIQEGQDELSRLDARIETMDAQLPSLLTSYNTAFQQSESQRSERYDLWSAAHQSKVDSEFQATAAKYAVGLEVLAKFQDEAAKVTGTVVDTAQAGAYATYAGDEKKSADLYRRMAIGMMVAAAGVLFLPELTGVLRATAAYTVDWQKALARLPFSLVLFAPALYLAKESGKHRINEVSNRRRQHILTTIGPYLALLDPARAETIKAEVARSIFSDSSPTLDDNNPDAAPVLAQVSALVEAILRRRS